MNICIFGDSWGVGEWGFDANNKYTLFHLGITKFFIDQGHNAVNRAAAGSSNNMSLKFMRHENLDFYDYVFWIQTDPLRDLRRESHISGQYTDEFHQLNTASTLIDKSNQLLDTTYRYLNQFDRPIYCIGGCSRLNIDLLKKYKNLTPLISSVPEFLYPEYNHPDIWHSDWLYSIEKNQLSLDNLDILLGYKQKQDLLYKEEYKEFFHPDGAHPNRFGHQRIFDYICKTVNLS